MAPSVTAEFDDEDFDKIVEEMEMYVLQIISTKH